MTRMKVSISIQISEACYHRWLKYRMQAPAWPTMEALAEALLNQHFDEGARTIESITIQEELADYRKTKIESPPGGGLAPGPHSSR